MNAAVSVIDVMPAPDVERRDEIDRLVAVTWYGSDPRLAARRNRWLVAVDGSDCSLRAVAMAARLALHDHEAAVDLVHVHPWLVKEAAESELARRGWEATAQARDILAAATVGGSVHVLMGDAGEQIVRMGEGRDISGIVIGSRGLSAAGSLLLGSVAYQVVHRSKVPVMIVR